MAWRRVARFRVISVVPYLPVGSEPGPQIRFFWGGTRGRILTLIGPMEADPAATLKRHGLPTGEGEGIAEDDVPKVVASLATEGWIQEPDPWAEGGGED